jgi:DNA-binding NarL/FixJ family response regulator
MAHKLGLVKRTVDFHVDNARIKLCAATRGEAVMKASPLASSSPELAQV